MKERIKQLEQTLREQMKDPELRINLIENRLLKISSTNTLDQRFIDLYRTFVVTYFEPEQEASQIFIPTQKLSFGRLRCYLYTLNTNPFFYNYLEETGFIKPLQPKEKELTDEAHNDLSKSESKIKQLESFLRDYTENSSLKISRELKLSSGALGISSEIPFNLCFRQLYQKFRKIYFEEEASQVLIKIQEVSFGQDTRYLFLLEHGDIFYEHLCQTKHIEPLHSEEQVTHKDGLSKSEGKKPIEEDDDLSKSEGQEKDQLTLPADTDKIRKGGDKEKRAMNFYDIPEEDRGNVYLTLLDIERIYDFQAPSQDPEDLWSFLQKKNSRTSATALSIAQGLPQALSQLSEQQEMRLFQEFNKIFGANPSTQNFNFFEAFKECFSDKTKKRILDYFETINDEFNAEEPSKGKEEIEDLDQVLAAEQIQLSPTQKDQLSKQWIFLLEHCPFILNAMYKTAVTIFQASFINRGRRGRRPAVFLPSGTDSTVAESEGNFSSYEPPQLFLRNSKHSGTFFTSAPKAVETKKVDLQDITTFPDDIWEIIKGLLLSQGEVGAGISDKSPDEQSFQMLWKTSDPETQRSLYNQTAEMLGYEPISDGPKLA